MLDLDEDGYPTEEALLKIEKWPFGDYVGLMNYVHSLWMYADWGWSQDEKGYDISTAGWSGNESLICALQDNRMFWMLCWEESRRGGHYKFTLQGDKNV